MRYVPREAGREQNSAWLCSQVEHVHPPYVPASYIQISAGSHEVDPAVLYLDTIRGRRVPSRRPCGGLRCRLPRGVVRKLNMSIHRTLRPVIFHALTSVWLLFSFGARALAQGYTNEAAQQGIDFTVPVPFPDFGTGVCFFDFDGDGWDDLSFGNVDGQLKFYRNVEGSLQAMPDIVNGEGNTNQILWADIDNDGDPDLLVTTFQGPVRLFRNDGNWNFVDVTATSGLVQEPGKRWGASFGDLDKDGFLDLYVCTYIYQPEPYEYSKLNHLYRNNGDGTFTDVTLVAGVGNGLRASFQSVWVDFDQDGWQDIYVINDFAASNALYHNNGDGTFTDMALELGLAETGEHCMSISLSDFDLDGDLDLYITNTGVFPLVNNARHMLLVNDGTGNFTESSTLYGLDIFEWGWGALWVDHDNDGYDDLYIATHRELYPAIPNLFYKNEGGASFTARPDLFPDPQVVSSHSVARGDLNGDGYADIVVHNQEPYPPMLWVNEGGTASHVRIGVEGVVSNRQAVGTWIRVYAAGRVHTHYTVCGENYMSQSSQYAHFGLGAALVIDSVVVEYLSGHVDRYYDLPVNGFYRFVEGETFTPVITSVNGFQACAPNVVVLDAGEHEDHLWNTGHTGRFLTVSQSGIYSVTATGPFGIAVTSAPVEVLIGPLPGIVAERNDPLCAGEASGGIALSNLAGVEAASVVWSNGGQGMSLTGLQAGVYNYTFTDVNGCTASGIVELMDPAELFVLVQSTPVGQGSDGSISWTVFGGVPPYQVIVDGEPVSGTTLGGLVAGVYMVVVIDAQGCVFEESVLVFDPASVGEVDAWMPRIYPNPVSSLLHVEWLLPLAQWRVIDATGRAVLEGEDGLRTGAVDVSELRTGAYLLELRDSGGRLARMRFVKE